MTPPAAGERRRRAGRRRNEAGERDAVLASLPGTAVPGAPALGKALTDSQLLEAVARWLGTAGRAGAA